MGEPTLAQMTQREWLSSQRARHGIARFVPFKYDLHQTTWGIIDLFGTGPTARADMIVWDGLTLLSARARCNAKNAQAKREREG